MAYAKRYKRKRSKRKSYRRRKRRKRKSRSFAASLNRPDFTTVLRFQDTSIENSNLVDEKRTLSYNLSDCANFANFTNIWDYYRINWVSVEFVPSTTAVVRQTNIGTASVPVSTTNQIPMCALAVDRDDASTAYTYDSLKNRSGSVAFPATKHHYFKFKPTRLNMVYLSGTATGYTIDTNTKQFLDAGQPTVPHYGLKFAMEPKEPGENFYYTIVQKVSVSFKQRRN